MTEQERSRRRVESDKWDRIADSMPDFAGAPSTGYYRESEVALIARAAGPLEGLRVLKLDLWNEAINTRILNWVAGCGAQAFGMDVSAAVVSRALRNCRDGGDNLRLVCADIRHLPYATGSFDVVYTMGTIEHIAEYRDALLEIRRVLRPGGRAIIGVPSRWDPFLRPLLVWTMELAGRYPYSPEKSFTSRELRGDVEAAGLRVLGRTGILFMPGVLRMIDLFLYTRKLPGGDVCRLLLRPFAWAERKWEWARRMGYLVTVVGEKPVEKA